MSSTLTHLAAHLAPTPEKVLEYVQGRTNGSACRRVQAKLRLRLGALPTPVTKGARFARARQAQSGERGTDWEMCFTSFECSHAQDQMGDRWGWEGPPDGSSDFNQLYSGILRRAMAYGAG